MATTAQVEANRRNARRSTGPRTASGKQRSAQNATTHGLTGRLPVVVLRGPFAEDPEEVQSFVAQVVAELDPGSLRERAEATYQAAIYVRLHRLLRLEAESLAHATRITPAEVAADLADPYTELNADVPGTEKAAARALNSIDLLARYEAHLSRLLDRSMSRYQRLQAERLGLPVAV